MCGLDGGDGNERTVVLHSFNTPFSAVGAGPTFAEQTPWEPQWSAAMPAFLSLPAAECRGYVGVDSEEDGLRSCRSRILLDRLGRCRPTSDPASVSACLTRAVCVCERPRDGDVGGRGSFRMEPATSPCAGRGVCRHRLFCTLGAIRSGVCVREREELFVWRCKLSAIGEVYWSGSRSRSSFGEETAVVVLLTTEVAEGVFVHCADLGVLIVPLPVHVPLQWAIAACKGAVGDAHDLRLLMLSCCMSSQSWGEQRR